MIEIGPGPGGLTRALLEAGAQHLIAFEADPRCVVALQPLVVHGHGRLDVRQADALTIALPSISEAPRKVVANLPYNVGTALYIQWLMDIHANAGAYTSLTLMFQKEVADRLWAVPGTKAYGRLSVLSQWLCEVTPVFDLPPEAFTPPPKVTSSVIQVTPLATPRYPAPLKRLETVLAAGFGQRRKMLRQALKPVFADPIEALNGLGIDPTRRAETLSVEEWCRVAHIS